MALPQLAEVFEEFASVAASRPQNTGDKTPSQVLAGARVYAASVTRLREALDNWLTKVVAVVELSPTDDLQAEEVRRGISLVRSFIIRELAKDDMSSDPVLRAALSRKPRQFRAKVLNGISIIRVADLELLAALRRVEASLLDTLLRSGHPPDPWPPEDRND